VFCDGLLLLFFYHSLLKGKKREATMGWASREKGARLQSGIWEDGWMDGDISCTCSYYFSFFSFHFILSKDFNGHARTYVNK